MMDFKSWPKRWNDASLRDIATLPEFSPSRPWPLLGMLAVGLVAGAAIGGYAVSQRARMKQLGMYAHRMGNELAGMDEDVDVDVETIRPVDVTRSARSNHRRKTTSRL
jgi:hypothetical protein